MSAAISYRPGPAANCFSLTPNVKPSDHVGSGNYVPAWQVLDSAPPRGMVVQEPPRRLPQLTLVTR